MSNSAFASPAGSSQKQTVSKDTNETKFFIIAAAVTIVLQLAYIGLKIYEIVSGFGYYEGNPKADMILKGQQTVSIVRVFSGCCFGLLALIFLLISFRRHFYQKPSIRPFIFTFGFLTLEIVADLLLTITSSIFDYMLAQYDLGLILTGILEDCIRKGYVFAVLTIVFLIATIRNPHGEKDKKFARFAMPLILLSTVLSNVLFFDSLAEAVSLKETFAFLLENPAELFKLLVELIYPITIFIYLCAHEIVDYENNI